ncbi:MAG: methyltransferase domain-containing protein [Anaerolineae bacterium]|nr:methyltransferase domain-containing protein [Anaerolineae bacterium]
MADNRNFIYNKDMRAETIEMLCNPYAGEPLRLDGQFLVGVSSGQRFAIRDGIPSFVPRGVGLSRRSRFWQWFYDRSAGIYDEVMDLGDRLRYTSEQTVRREYISRMAINPGDKLLETACGTGSNFEHLPADGLYYGLDISWNMLRRAQRNLEKRGSRVELLHADGQQIPLRDGSFDHVLHMGGLQFYGDPFLGVREMARVVKPGGRVVILDEAAAAYRIFKRSPAHARHAPTKAAAVGELGRLAPHGAQDVRCGMVAGTHFFELTFRRPE